MDVPASNRSLGELFSDLSQKTSTLIRQEMALARTEMMQKAAQAGRDAAWVGVGGAVLYAAVLGAMAAVVLGLIRVGLPAWGAAALTTAVFAIAGLVLVRSNLAALRKQRVAPTETVESLKETAQWIKNETR